MPPARLQRLRCRRSETCLSTAGARPRLHEWGRSRVARGSLCESGRVVRLVERPLCQTRSGGVAVIASSPHYAPAALLKKCMTAPAAACNSRAMGDVKASFGRQIGVSAPLGARAPFAKERLGGRACGGSTDCRFLRTPTARPHHVVDFCACGRLWKFWTSCV